MVQPRARADGSEPGTLTPMDHLNSAPNSRSALKRSGATMNRSLFIFPLVATLCVSMAPAEDRHWQDNKLTPEQPFPAAVRAVLQEWPGYHLLLEEIGGSGRLCLAKVWMTEPLEYTVVQDTKAEIAAENERKKARWIYVSPAIEVSQFSWCLGPWNIGRKFGEEDLLRKAMKPKEPAK
jgi:hypothetical protein